MSGNQTAFLDFTDKVEHLLGSAHGKGGDDHVSAPVQRALNDAGQKGHWIIRAFVEAVAIGGLAHDIVCGRDGGGDVADDIG